METEKLYYADPFLRQFTATVLACEEAKGGYKVVLDRTAFYPEGGGQPADHGQLDGIAVTDVHKKGGVILVVEAIAYVLLWKEHDRERAISCALVSNAASALIGWFISQPVWDFVVSIS